MPNPGLLSAVDRSRSHALVSDRRIGPWPRQRWPVNLPGPEGSNSRGDQRVAGPSTFRRPTSRARPREGPHKGCSRRPSGLAVVNALRRGHASEGPSAMRLRIGHASDAPSACALRMGRASDAPSAMRLRMGHASDAPSACPLRMGHASERPSACPLRMGHACGLGALARVRRAPSRAAALGAPPQPGRARTLTVRARVEGRARPARAPRSPARPDRAPAPDASRAAARSGRRTRRVG